MPTTTAPLKSINTVMVPVTDQDRAIAFYTEHLGFEKTADIAFGDGDSERWVELSIPGAETTLAPTTQRGEDWVAGRSTGISLLTGDIDSLQASLVEAGVDVDPQVTRIDGPPPPMLWLRDPDGNSLLVVEA